MAERPHACLWAERKDGRPYRLTPDEALARVDDRLILHARVEPVFAASIGDDGFTLHGPDLADLRAAAADIQALAAHGGARPGRLAPRLRHRRPAGLAAASMASARLKP